VFRHSGETDESPIWKRTASVPDLHSLLSRFLGQQRADEAFSLYAEKRQIDWKASLTADAGLVNYSEKLLAGVIGSASARVMVDSVVKEEPIGIDEVMNILDETRQVIAYSRELEKATSELQAANERLKELDQLKDDFISTVTHELRTPLTSVRSLAEILHESPDITPEKHSNFTAIIINESKRLTRLISQILDYQKMESGRMEWQISLIDLKEILNEAVNATGQLIHDRNIKVNLDFPDVVPLVPGDRDRLIQVMFNLVSNAVKFCNDKDGVIGIKLSIENKFLRIDVSDNGIGISREHQDMIFEKFKQVIDAKLGRPRGTGLGLTITKRIIDHHSGKIWVESEPGKGSTFSFIIPLSA